MTDTLAARLLPTLHSAKKRKTATFEQFVVAFFGSRQRFSSPDATVEAYHYYLPFLLEDFQNNYGDVINFLPARKTLSAVALIRKSRKWMGYSLPWPAHLDVVAVANATEPLEIASCTYELDRLLIEARRLLGSHQRPMALEKIYSVYTSVIGALEYCLSLESMDSARFKEEVQRKKSVLDSLIVDTKDFLYRAAQRKSQGQYFLGMLLGLLLLGLTSPLAKWLLSAFPSSDFNARTAVGCFVAGGIGALLSVMYRMTSGQLVLDYEVGKLTTTAIGIFRPLVGALFAIVLYLFLVSGLVSLAPPKPAQIEVFYWCLAFLAGFSERFVPDLLTQTEKQLANRIVRGASAEGDHSGTSGRHGKP